LTKTFYILWFALKTRECTTWWWPI